MDENTAIGVKEIPRMNIQWDWKEALRNPRGKAWISCKQENQPTIYGELVAHEEGDSVKIQATDGFEVTNVNRNSLALLHSKTHCTTKFISPTEVFSNLHNKSVRCIDVSPGGGLAVSSGDDGTLLLWDTSNGVLRRQLEGHISDVNTCCFFPSGKVVLSGGADLRLKIWSTEDGSCPVTLKGHTGGVVDTAIVDRGRNVLSCSRDGTARLWDCGEAKCLAVVFKSDCCVNACALMRVPEMENGTSSDIDHSEREIGTAGKLLLLGMEDGSFDALDIYNRKKVSSKLRFPFSVPIGVSRRSASPVLSLLTFGNRGVFASSGDGSCFLWSSVLLRQTEQDALTSWELIGPDCDPVYRMSRSSNTVYTACRDTNIRKYVLKDSELPS
ncbi:PREDICTED: proteasomal ATPase-associated factor 1-like [Acropora digitifera]|uniref:proteasomal ATPase-associated factor 1-like n=1 Tax=Acropora digitifera TaxID=70779 RepID=UPI00077B1BFC|nr:PREDICTED: proteasomal ATPase-associated factor 1-like [Acropora digitifera]